MVFDLGLGAQGRVCYRFTALSQLMVIGARMQKKKPSVKKKLTKRNEVILHEVIRQTAGQIMFLLTVE